MRVEKVDEIPEGFTGIALTTSDSTASRLVQNFLAALGGEDSLFQVGRQSEGTVAGSSASGNRYAGEFTLVFRHGELARDRELQSLLLERVIELLKNAGSAEFLSVVLCLTSSSQRKQNGGDPGLWMRLEASGDSNEHAALRWGLGLTHVQQALLFASRLVRHYLAQKGK